VSTKSNTTKLVIKHVPNAPEIHLLSLITYFKFVSMIINFLKHGFGVN